MKNLLFLCTGNYYRSRFCEEYFNHQAQRHRLAWQADSRGLAPDISVFGNPGPLSPHTRQALAALGVPMEATRRAPRSIQPADWDWAHRIIALSCAEHQPMVEQCFPAVGSRVEYWDIGDLPLASPTEAIPAMTRAVQGLINVLVRGALPVCTPVDASIDRVASATEAG